jgi:hypothetical protein
MKRILPLVLCAVWIGWRAVSSLAAAAPPLPVYIFLTSTIDDPINTDISEDRIRRIIGMLEKYRGRTPSAGIGATLLFSGAMSEELEKHNQLLDLLKTSLRSGLIQAGYDGSAEPTFFRHPALDTTGGATPEDHWNARLVLTERLLTAARNPLTGETLPTGSGGLKKMQEVLGPAAYIRGIYLTLANMYHPMQETGPDSEIVQVLQRYNTTAVMEGLADTNVAHAGSDNYRGWVDALSTALSQDPDTSPELFWQDGMLRSSEDGKRDLRLFRASQGVDDFKKYLAGLDRSRIRIVHIQIGNQANHAKPNPARVRPDVPLFYAWTHPADPKYPAALRHSEAEIDAAYAKEDAVLNYLQSEFFAANPGSRFVSTADLKSMTPPAWGYELRMDSLRPAIQQMIAAWGDDKHPPRFLRVEGHYLSEADLFAVMADALAQMYRTGAMPTTVRVPHVFGPIRTAQPSSPTSGEVVAGSVARVSARLVEELNYDKWTPIPRNAVPSAVVINGLALNPAQFLRLMAEAVVAPSAETKLTIKPSEMFWGPEPIFYRRRPIGELGAAWTYKPAPIK